MRHAFGGLTLSSSMLTVVSSVARAGPPCTCLSMCTLDSAFDTIRRLPPVITSHDSPWSHYLDAVYKGRVQLPFDMRRLRLLYHNTPEWRARHPDVHWPMSPCEPARGYRPPLRGSEPILTQVGSRMLQIRAAQPEPPRCADCSGWLLPRNSTNSPDANLRVATWGRRDSTLSEVSWWAYPTDRCNFPSHSWVEVMHFGRRPEGTRAYGYAAPHHDVARSCAHKSSHLHPRASPSAGCTSCARQWFHPFTGTDVWVNIGKTIHFSSKRAAFEGLVGRWARLRGLPESSIRTPAQVVAEVGRWVMATPYEPYDFATFLASELGYDSLQMDNGFVPDFAYISPPSLIQHENCRHASMTFPYSAQHYRQLAKCGPRNRTCPFRVPMRTAAAKVECACLEHRSLINCNASPLLPGGGWQKRSSTAMMETMKTK